MPPSVATLVGLLEIEINNDITTIVNLLQEEIGKLPQPPLIYQRARQLCLLAHGIIPPKWLRRPPEMPVIVALAPAHLREIASQVALWKKWDARDNDWKFVLPPTWAIDSLMARPVWPFPVLEGIVGTPTLRPDGTLLTAPGYDPDTGLVLDLNGTTYPPLKDDLTLDDARTAVSQLKEPFENFLFLDDSQKSATLAAILSLVARYAIQGNVPLFAVRSTIRGSGKGLLIDAISVIGTGRQAPRWAQTTDPEEERKRLLTIAMAGDAVTHIDNVTGPLGSAALDLALTAPTFSDRILGQQVSREAPMHVVFFASGNNMQFQGDLARRVVPIDLDPKMERPEERNDFKHSPLLPWVLKERPRFVMAALTILKAYFAAGTPKHKDVKAFGSFEEWSTLIRQALVWAGEPDPCKGRADIEVESDPQYEALYGLLEAWYGRYGEDFRTIRQVKDDLDGHAARAPNSTHWIVHPDWRPLRSALAGLDKRGEVNERSIGYALRGWKGRMIGDKRFVMEIDKHAKVNQWRIEVLQRS